MAIKQMKPTTPARRQMTSQDLSGITAKKPVRSLVKIKKITAGRNNQGRITTRHKGGGVKRYHRNVNFGLAKGTSATIEHIEYDPNRSARLARLKEDNGTYHYNLASSSMKVGDKVVSGDDAPVEAGNRLPLKNIPTGSSIYAIELEPGKGAKLVRSAGTSAQLVAKDGTYAQVRLPSGEIRLVHTECMAHIGTIGNDQHQKIGRAHV